MYVTNVSQCIYTSALKNGEGVGGVRGGWVLINKILNPFGEFKNTLIFPFSV